MTAASSMSWRRPSEGACPSSHTSWARQPRRVRGASRALRCGPLARRAVQRHEPGPSRDIHVDALFDVLLNEIRPVHARRPRDVPKSRGFIAESRLLAFLLEPLPDAAAHRAVGREAELTIEQLQSEVTWQAPRSKRAPSESALSGACSPPPASTARAHARPTPREKSAAMGGTELADDEEDKVHDDFVLSSRTSTSHFRPSMLEQDGLRGFRRWSHAALAPTAKARLPRCRRTSQPTTRTMRSMIETLRQLLSGCFTSMNARQRYHGV